MVISGWVVFIIFQFEVVAVEYCIAVVFNPVTQVNVPAVFWKRNIERQMPVTKYEIIVVLLL